MRRARANADADSEADEEISAVMSASYRAIFDVVVKIPRGKVMTYGQVAETAGLRGAARLVGYAMRALGHKLPWQRVLGMRKKGTAQVAIKDPIGGTEQRIRLEREGVRFSLSGGVDLARYGHAPPARRKASARKGR